MPSKTVASIIEFLFENVSRGFNTLAEAQAWAGEIGVHLSAEERSDLDVALRDLSQLQAHGGRIVARGRSIYPAMDSVAMLARVKASPKARLAR